MSSAGSRCSRTASPSSSSATPERSTTVGTSATDRKPARHLVAVHQGRHADQRVVAVTARDLLERDPGAGCQRREARLDRDLVARDRRLERADEELVGRDRTPPAPDRPRRATRRADAARPASRPQRRRGRASRRSYPCCGSSRGPRARAPSRSSGCTSRASVEASTAACRASAPTRTPSAEQRTWSRSGSALMSTRVDGAASRIESSGTSDWPPASTFAPGDPGELGDGVVERPGSAVREGCRLHVATGRPWPEGSRSAPLGPTKNDPWPSSVPAALADDAGQVVADRPRRPCRGRCR